MIIVPDGSALSFSFQLQVSLSIVMTQDSRTNTKLYFFLWLGGFLVMLYYDYLLTLPREIQFLWPPHNTQGWFTLACFLNRYIPIIGVLPIVVSYLIPVNTAVRPFFPDLPSLTHQRALTKF